MKMYLQKSLIAAGLFAATIASPVQAEITEKSISIGTASQGGAWYGVAARIFKDVEAAAPDLTVQVQPGGGFGNIRKVDDGAIDLGMTLSFANGLAYGGSEPFKKVRDDYVFLAKLFPGYTKIYTVKSAGIEKFEDLFDKRVTGGKSGWAGEMMFRLVLDSYDMDYDKIQANGGVVNFVGTDQATQMMRDGNLDAMFITGNPPTHPKFNELATTTPIDVLDMGDAALDQVTSKYPFLTRTQLPTDMYPGVEGGFDTISGDAVLIARRDMSDDLAYLIVKTFYENLEKTKQDMPMLNENTLEDALKGNTIDIHPGAIRYYKEVGLM